MIDYATQDFIRVYMRESVREMRQEYFTSIPFRNGLTIKEMGRAIVQGSFLALPGSIPVATKLWIVDRLVEIVKKEETH
jgi:hypothetical protein